MKWIDKLEPATVLDAAKFVASGAVATGAEAVAGYTGAVVGAVTGDADKAGNAVRSTKEWLNWTPEYSSDTAAQLSEVVGPAAEAFGKSSEKVADRSGRWAMEATGSAAVGALVKGGIRVVPELRGKWFHDAPKNKIVEAAKDSDKIVEAESLAFNGKDTWEIAAKTGLWKGQDGRWRAWISDKEAKLKPEALAPIKEGGSIELKAGELMDHPELFDKIPGVADTPVVITVDPNYKKAAGAAWYNPNDKTIYIFARKLDTRRDMSTLMHEVQHVVQEKDALVGGYNAEVAAKIVKAAGLESTIKKLRKLESKFARENNQAELDNVQTALLGLDPEYRYTHNIGEREAQISGLMQESRAGATPQDMASLLEMISRAPGVNHANLDVEKALADRGLLDRTDIINSVPSIRDNPDVLKYVKGEQE